MISMRILIVSCLVLLTNVAVAQVRPIQNPCLQVLPNPTDYVAAFEAEGWILVEDDARIVALQDIALLLYVSKSLVAPPETAEALAEMKEIAGSERYLRYYEWALVLTRGDAVAAVEFNDPDQMRPELGFSCWIGAPDLPEIEAMSLEALNIGARETALAFVRQEIMPPDGATAMNLDGLRLVTAFETTMQAEAIVVEMTRKEPRYVLRQQYGLLRAFGQDEYADALNGEIE
jgi:hypothetical protein